MHIPLSTTVALLSVLSGQQALAAPVPEEESSSGLVSRNGGTGNTSSDPVEVVWKQNTKSQIAFEIDCYAILCQKKPRLLRYEDDSGKRAHTTGSGAWNSPSNPFKDPLTGISKCLQMCKVMTQRRSILSRLPMKEDRGMTYIFALLPTEHLAGLCSIESALLGPAPQNPVQSF